MAQDDLRTVIRELLAEELAKVRGAMKTASAAPGVRDEEVSIASDAELDAFVKRLLSLAKDDHARADIEAGRHAVPTTSRRSSRFPLLLPNS